MEVFGSVEHDSPPFEGVRIFGIRQVFGAKAVADHTCFHDRTVKQVALEIDEPRLCFQGLRNRLDHLFIFAAKCCAIFTHRLAIRRHCIGIG